jgi:hypothetical protein
MKTSLRYRHMRHSSIKTMLLTFGLIGFLAGCSSYSVKETPFIKPEAMPYTRTEGMVLIGVDPYVQSDKVIALFGEDLLAVSVIPIQVVVRNMGERPFRVETKNFKLSLPGDEVVAPRPGSDVAGLFSPHSGVLDHAATGIGLLGGLGGAIGGLVASVVGGVASGSIKGSQRDALLARQEDYTRKELKGVTLGTGESTRGFLFFSLPAGTAAFNEATLILDAYGSDTDNRSIKVPLKNLGYKGKGASDK